MSSSTKKRKTTKKPSSKRKKTEPTPNPSLPNDLLLSCFARASRLYYPTLSLVSKSFGSLIASPELYQTRSSLGNTESCLYMCLYYHPHSSPNPRWYTLCKKPNPNITNDTSSGYVLAAIPSPCSPPPESFGLVSIGSNIYNIGRPYVSSSVSVLDCRTHIWREAPRMHVERRRPATFVFDGKIYVAGGFKFEDSNSSNWMEVFDPKTQTWEPVPCPGADTCTLTEKSAGIDGKLCMFGKQKGLAYKPKEGTSEEVSWLMGSGWESESYCVVENVLYCYDYFEGKFKWYNSKVTHWRDVNGVEGLPRDIKRFCYPRLANYGGKMVFLWQNNCPSGEKIIISCAVIALERRNEEIWGSVEWSDVVLTAPYSCRIEYALSATV